MLPQPAPLPLAGSARLGRAMPTTPVPGCWSSCSSSHPAARRLQHQQRGAGTAVAVAAAPTKGGSSGGSSRNAGLYDLDVASGWGVQAETSSGSSSGKGAAKQASKKAAKSAKAAQQQAQQQQAQQPPKRARKQDRSTPYVELRSPEGVMELTMLRQTLEMEEAAAAGTATTSPSPSRGAGNPAAAATLPAPVAGGVGPIKQSVMQAASSSRRRRAGALPAATAAAAAAAQQLEQGIIPYGQRQQQLALQQQLQQYGEEDDNDEDSKVPEFQITFGPTGTELVEFDRRGRRLPARAPGGAAAGEEDESGSASKLAVEEFDQFGWEQFDLADGEEDGDSGLWEDAEEVGTAGAGPLAGEEDGDVALLRDLSNEDDWGLDGVLGGSSAVASSSTGSGSGSKGGKAGRRKAGSVLSALEAAAAEEAAAFEASGISASSVQWGGTGGASGLDHEEQEALLRRFFTPNKVAQLMAHQREAERVNGDLKRLRATGGMSDHKLHQQLRIAGGAAAGRKLLSSKGAQTRPMMEKVRQAIFSMIQSRAGSVSGLPPGSRWLDLFAGTGSIGLEALSRGAREAHFVEMDPWVVKKVLGRNIGSLGYSRSSTIHTSKAEEFLRRAAALPRFAGGAFDFISVCPPYLLVSYPELYDLLDASPLIHERSIVFVEYPKQLRHEIRDNIGPLSKVRDRKYGRTLIAVYAAPMEGDEQGGADEVGAARGADGVPDPEHDPLLEGLL